jgi:hypothetical protein
VFSFSDSQSPDRHGHSALLQNDFGLLDLLHAASRNVTAFIKGKTFTKTFSGVPINISLAQDQTGVIDCPILDLQLGPITVDLLGLVVETSPICLKITAFSGGGLLGDLLCGIATGLEGGIPLNVILAGLGDLPNLLDGLTDLCNGALGRPVPSNPHSH